MEEKLKNSMRFYMLATQLKYKIRSGWDKSHWNVSKERVESIAEHVYGTCILALSIDSEFKTDLDINKVIKMLVLHELGEVIIGDITPFDNITPEEKMKKEHEAMREVIGDLVNQEEFLSLLFEFDEKKTKEAIFAHHCDKLEADIQAKVYQDMGCQHPLDEQEDNVVFKSNKVQQMVNDGAQTAFDIWYEWDKSLYCDDEDFARLLDYVRTINTQELLK
jgi:serine/threonine kinase